METVTVKLKSLEYPPRIQFGSLKTLVQPFSYGNQIKMFLLTVKGERPLLPDYGLPRLIHQPDPSPQQIEIIIRNGLTKYFPQLEFRKIECTDNPDILGYKTVIVEYFADGKLRTVEVNLNGDTN